MPGESTMDKAKRAELEARGYWVGDAADLLALDDPERKLVEYRVRLAIGVREAREQADLTQAGLAERIRSSQAQIARIEAGDRGVTIDLMLKALFAAGGDISTLPVLGPLNEPTRKLKRSEPTEVKSPKQVSKATPKKRTPLKV